MNSWGLFLVSFIHILTRWNSHVVCSLVFVFSCKHVRFILVFGLVLFELSKEPFSSNKERFYTLKYLAIQQSDRFEMLLLKTQVNEQPHQFSRIRLKGKSRDRLAP